jgi:4-amino-4-deoxy-L-arabinose transferase-like glycosyltransferase
LGVLLVATATLYLWGLSASGWANGFYSAAAQAAGVSGKAWFFGSSDAANWITVDKTPAALWVDGLAVRLFGLSSWSVLAPQAVLGVATVALLYASVRRTALTAGLASRLATGAALFAGVALAVTPVAVLIFRFNNPDALLTLLLVGAAYATLRAVERGGTRWLLLAAALVGFGFLTKMLQAFLVLPALAAVWLLAAPVGWGRRLRDLALAAVALVVSAGWWVLVVELWPAADRPYIGGSQDNSVLELVFGYNGFGRLTGDEVGSVGGGGTGGVWGRLFGAEMAGGIAWLLPAAVVVLIGGLWATRRHGPQRTSLLLWGGWLVVTAAVFSLMDGIIHAYYTVALAPALAGVIGIGAVALWRTGVVGTAVLSGAVALTAIETYLLLDSLMLLVFGLVAAALVLLVEQNVAVAALAAVVALAGPAAYSLQTAAATHSGAIPSAGPSMGNVTFAGPGGMGGLLDAPKPGADLVALLRQGDHTWAAATVGSNNAAGYQLASGKPVLAVGGFNGTDPAPTLAEFQEMVHNGQIHWFIGDGAMSSTATGGSDAGRQIAEWVAENYPAQQVSGVTVYDLS